MAGEGEGQGQGQGEGAAGAPGAAGTSAGGGSTSPAAGSQGASGTEGQGAAGAAGGSSEAGASGAPSTAADWRDARIAELSAKLKAERAKNGAGAAPGAAAPGATAAAPANLTQEEFDRRVEEASNQKAAAKQFNSAADAAALAGQQKYGVAEFNRSVGGLMQLVDRNDPAQVITYNTFLMAALETGAAPDLVFELGQDLNEAQRIMSLPPVKMAVELTKRAVAAAGRTEGEGEGKGKGTTPGLNLKPPPKPFSTTVANRSGPHTPIDPGDPGRADNLNSAEWHKRRAEQKAERAKSRGY